ncbi:MAG: beta-lactamase domain protein [Fluviicola sp.]|jgi:glyoxylase-like metal-dependent hydrolase (beta-lactamase superfamily II)|uniref:MBL fold metallo-hydrolase n=1 Tax=Fluviicola sp. TaxID=1917219 RepID=UPI002607D653|nr:MBL fold metallo-hydrolase [Fluviicola sp.]MDF3027996.1 beta-lactamase domain protein [Fluviicola sp.]
MKVQTFTFNAVQENSSVVYNNNGDAVIIDPGCYERFEQKELTDFISDNNLKVHAILNTHCHIDHVLGNAFCVNEYQVPLIAHKEELFTLSFAERSAEMFGFSAYVPSPEPTVFVEDMEIIRFGELEFRVIFGPGHCVGHVAFYNEEAHILIGGDILFKGSFGRTDLPGGSMEVLKKTIFERMFTLPDNTVVYPGHGPTTTIGEEKRTNYILQF